MRIQGIDLYEYSLPLKKRLPLKGVELTVRRGLLLRLTDADGNIGWGEIAPLPGFSNETLDEVRAQACFLRGLAIGIEVPEIVFHLDGSFGRLLDPFGIHASVRFGIEMAVLNLMASATGKTLAHLLSDSPRASVSVNGLIGGDDFRIAEEAIRFRDAGYRAVKLKVGGKVASDEIERVRILRETLGDGIAIRLDANRSFEFEDAVAFARRIEPMHIEYVEEPSRDSSRLPEFAASTGVNIALDESLIGLKPDELRPYQGLRAIILKPTLLGGFERASQFVRKADEFGLMPVISSTFESGLGIFALANFAGAFPAASIPCGLDTLDRFAEDLLKSRLAVTNGTINLEIVRSGIEVDLSRLVEVASA
jgi:O-succinylbenzoate synthase